MPGSQDISSAADRRRILNRLRRLGGQVRGLATMVTNEKPCEEVLTQVLAAKSALDRVGVHAIAYTVKCCRTSADDPPGKIVDEALNLFVEYRRSAGSLGTELVVPLGEGAAHTGSLLERLADRVSALEVLVETEQECDAILDAIIQARALLDQVGLNVVAGSMSTCLAPGAHASRDEVVDDALAVFIRYIGTAK
jgi:CsoR family transcriptional regulator, copper-sensing transcriptional repressor